MNLGINKHDIAFLKALQEELLTQDPVGQAAPRFWVVRGSIKQYGMEVGWSTNIALRIDFETMLETLEEAYEYLLDHYPKTPYRYDEEENLLSCYDTEKEEWIDFSGLEDVAMFLQNQGNSEAEIIGYQRVEHIYENTLFLTYRECLEHIESNRHHYSLDAHPYAMTACKAPQVRSLWNILERINWDKIEKLMSEA